ncbi:MAG: lysophospholipid acyltransferase family protein, partial [Ruthenibacterium sp.]
MAKKELFRDNWFSRGMANVCGMIPIDRSGIVAEAMSSVREKLQEKWGVLIHPEGTRTTDGQLGAFKNGAAVLAIEANVPVVPAYIKGGYEVFPCWRKRPLLFNWKKMRKYEVEV